MTSGSPEQPPVRIVLGDANVLYPRILRDYLLYAATRRIIAVRWSTAILDEVVENLVENVPGFNVESGGRLIAAMNGAFPNASVTPSESAHRQLAGVALPDEGDRHVLVAAVAAGAEILCTDNVKHFPPWVMFTLGIEVLTADQMLSRLITNVGEEMLIAHRMTVARLAGATDESTIAALRRAGAHRTADLMAGLLGIAAE